MHALYSTVVIIYYGGCVEQRRRYVDYVFSSFKFQTKRMHVEEWEQTASEPGIPDGAPGCRR